MFCPQCGREVSADQPFCHGCGVNIRDASPAVEGRTRTPWEDRSTVGGLRGIMETLKGSLFAPGNFFKNMPVTGGLTDPIVYALITGMVGIMAFYLWQTLLHDALPVMMPHDIKGPAAFDALSGIHIAVIAFAAPFSIILNLFIWSGLLHLLLLLVQGAKNGFEATFRVAAYSYGANIFLAVPFCGWPLAIVWSIVLVIIGLKESHGTTGGKSAFVVLFPLIMCCAAAVLFSVLILGTVAASLGTMTNQPWK
ncbi:MAG: YIP1 family protein [Nitrospirota bacterium]|nr:YIP1 family protein [Nitrospirota bacterium]